MRLSDWSSDVCSSDLEVKEYIQNNYTRPGCQVKQLARKFSSTGRTLSREYKKEFGITIQEHIIKLRMALATKLLEQNCLIKEVTTAVGYQNPFSFSRMFKKYYGYQPTKKNPRRKLTCFV